MKIDKKISFYLLNVFVFVFLLMNCGGGNKSTVAEEKTADLDTECDTIAVSSAAKSLNLFSEKTSLTEDDLFVRSAYAAVAAQIQDVVEPVLEPSSFVDGRTTKHVQFYFKKQDVRLCSEYVTANKIDDKIYMTGQFPSFSSLQIEKSLTWEDFDFDLSNVLLSLHIKGRVDDLDYSPCISTARKDMKAAWSMHFKVDGRPYSAIRAGGDVISTSADFFDLADGESRIYVKDSSSADGVVFKVVTLKDISSGGSLCSPRFKTDVPASFKRAYSARRSFFFQDTDPSKDLRFSETSLFTNISEHSDWFMAQATAPAEWPGPRVLVTALEGAVNGYSSSGGTGTPSYYPAVKVGDVASIKMGRGDDVLLQKLFIEPEVISHELGHHILYTLALRTTFGESLVLHEGLADFLVFLRTDNPNLCELSCPPKSTLCITPAYLRSAENTLKYTDKEFAGLSAHKASQFVSGMMWDMRKSLGLKAITDIFIKAIPMLDQKAGYANLVYSLMLADKSLNQSKSACQIQTMAEDRGLKDVLTNAGVSCSKL